MTQEAVGGFWPYLVILLVGVLPTGIWRVLAVALSRGLREDSEVLTWVRLVATALLMGVVSKLLFTPNGALALIPLWGRLGAIAAGVMAQFATRGSILTAVVVGELVLIAAGYFK